MAIQQDDKRGNEWFGSVDLITGQVVVEARPLTATLGALNAESVSDLNGQANMLVDIRTAAMSATLVFEGTVDGTNYVALTAYTESTQVLTQAVVVTTTLAQVYALDVSGYKRVRIRVSAYTSGSCVVATRASSADHKILTIPYPTTTTGTLLTTANTAGTLTLAAAGAGLFHYITRIEIKRVNGTAAAVVGTAALSTTTTNLTGAPAWTTGNALAVGEHRDDVIAEFSGNPLKSTTANTNTTFVLPAGGAGIQYRINVSYYVGA